MKAQGPIGVFDSGYGGLTVLRSIQSLMPSYDYLYLGDSARSPYGSRSFDNVYDFTLSGVRYLFEQGCHLVILACNTASAKALRTIQQRDLPIIAPDKRVLGVIRPTSEAIGNYSSTGSVGLFATYGTVLSDSYRIEIEKFFPDLKLVQEACPMWVPLVENGELDNNGTHFFIKRHIDTLFAMSAQIDTILLACTHYPLLLDLISNIVGDRAEIISQGPLVADRLHNYLERHPEISDKCSRYGTTNYLTTDDPAKFEMLGTQFLGKSFSATKVHL
ncbi:MAG: glutamate racemase [Cyclobacteriaceae bacterium]|jgi:glutamate racemase